MPRHPGRRTLAVAGSLLLLATVVAACGRTGRDGASVADLPGATVPPSTRDVLETAGPGTTTPPATPADATTDAPPGDPTAISTAALATGAPAGISTPGPAPTVAPSVAPLATPDLTAIQHLLDELDAALGADATADTDEGSAD